MQAPQLLRVRLKASKTDPFRVGVDVFIGKTDDGLSPVAAVLAYMVRGNGPGPFFKFQDGSPLTRPRLVAEVKQSLKKAGVDSRAYAGLMRGTAFGAERPRQLRNGTWRTQS